MRTRKWMAAAVLAVAAMGVQADDRWFVVSGEAGCIAHDSVAQFENKLLAGGLKLVLVERGHDYVLYGERDFVDAQFMIVKGLSKCRQVQQQQALY